jgi:GrpB-like predicted nucleotidyltransferase (UPF0157 family)
MKVRVRFAAGSHFAAAQREFQKHRNLISERLPWADVRQVGGTALAGALTKGDLDIQVRVPAKQFVEAVSELRRLYTPWKLHVWTSEFATFFAPAYSLPEETGISVAVIGSRSDRAGAGVWDRLAAEPELLEAYNALKTQHMGGDWRRYEVAKSAFFAALLD